MPHKRIDSETQQQIETFAFNHLHDIYGFGLTEIGLFNLSPSEINTECNKMIERGLATAETVKDTFIQLYQKHYSSKLIQSFNAKTASAFGDQKTEYIWFPYIVRNEVNILMASGGSGKTFLTCLEAAYISNGLAFPGDFKPQNGAENVLMINGEETGELIKKRLLACDANLERVFILDCIDSVGLDFGANIQALQKLIEQYKPAMTVIDPLQSFIGEDADLNKVNHIRPIMQRLAKVAKEENTAIVLVMHVNKRPQTNNLNDSASGSTDFVNASRSAMYILFDEEIPNSRLMIHSKYNYSAAGKTVRFTFDEKGAVFFNGYSDIDRFTVEEANRKRKTPGEVVRANAEQTEATDILIRALLEAADKNEIRRYSYDAFKEKYGSSIFGTQQPKRCLDSVASSMMARGFLIEAGKKVKDGDLPKNGFIITPITEDENRTQIGMVDDL